MGRKLPHRRELDHLYGNDDWMTDEYSVIPACIDHQSSGEPPGHTVPDRGSPSSKGGGDFSYQTFHHPDQIELFAPVQLALPLAQRVALSQIQCPGTVVTDASGVAMCQDMSGAPLAWTTTPAFSIEALDPVMSHARNVSDARRLNRRAIEEGRSGPAVMYAEMRAKWLVMRNDAMRMARYWARDGYGGACRVYVAHARKANQEAITRGRWARGLA